MLKRKESKMTNGAEHNGHRNERPAPAKGLRRRRFIISPKAPKVAVAQPESGGNGSAKPPSASPATAAFATSHWTPAACAPDQGRAPTGTIETLLHLSHEPGP